MHYRVTLIHYIHFWSFISLFFSYSYSSFPILIHFVVETEKAEDMSGHWGILVSDPWLQNQFTQVELRSLKSHVSSSWLRFQIAVAIAALSRFLIWWEIVDKYDWCEDPKSLDVVAKIAVVNCFLKTWSWLQSHCGVS